MPQSSAVDRPAGEWPSSEAGSEAKIEAVSAISEECGVIDLVCDNEGENEQLEDMPSDSSSESSSSSSSGIPSPASVSASVAPRHVRIPFAEKVEFCINQQSLVIHRLRNETTFRCGRKLGSKYAAVKDLNGLRCGICFHD